MEPYDFTMPMVTLGVRMLPIHKMKLTELAYKRSLTTSEYTNMILAKHCMDSEAVVVPEKGEARPEKPPKKSATPPKKVAPKKADQVVVKKRKKKRKKSKKTGLKKENKAVKKEPFAVDPNAERIIEAKKKADRVDKLEKDLQRMAKGYRREGKKVLAKPPEEDHECVPMVVAYRKKYDTAWNKLVAEVKEAGGEIEAHPWKDQGLD